MRISLIFCSLGLLLSLSGCSTSEFVQGHAQLHRDVRETLHGHAVYDYRHIRDDSYYPDQSVVFYSAPGYKGSMGYYRRNLDGSPRIHNVNWPAQVASIQTVGRIAFRLYSGPDGTGDEVGPFRWDDLEDYTPPFIVQSVQVYTWMPLR